MVVENYFFRGENLTENAQNRKQRAKIVLAHVSLVILSIIYIICGAGIFHTIEGPNEIAQKKQSLDQIAKFRREFISKMWAASRKPNVDGKRWAKMVDKELDVLAETLHSAFTTGQVTLGDVKMNSTKSGHKWSFSGGLLFSVSTLSAIGYGHLTPKTTVGKTFCVIFAFFGLPLIWITILDLALMLSIPALKLHHYYAQLLQVINRSCANLITKIRKRRRDGLSLSQIKPRDESGETHGDINPTGIDGVDERTRLAPAEVSGAKNGVGSMANKSGDRSEIVSISFLILILVGYTLVGAILIPLWEHGNEWNFWNAYYFCFITLTTIGFGDIAPQNQTYFLLTIIYIMIGMIITTMCVQLYAPRFAKKEATKPSRRVTVHDVIQDRK